MSLPRVFICLACLAALLLAGCQDQASPTGRVVGYIFISPQAALTLERSGTLPAANAEVTIAGTKRRALTDANGYFTLERVPTGTCVLTATLAGFQSLTLSITVKKGATTTVDDTLAPSRRWTVLVFMNADNDLEGFGVEDVNEMESVPASDAVTVAVQMDRAPGFDATNGNWTGTRRFKIEHDDDLNLMTSPVLQEMGEVDMGQPETLQDFIRWGKARYPAQQYLVVVWNHGSGWRSRAADASSRAVSFDDTSGTYIRTPELPAALAASPPLDIVSFDSSLMQMLEIAYEMRASCGLVVGSEESPPGAGYPYQTWLADLVTNPQMTARTLADAMARDTLAYYGAGSNITHSVLDTAQLPALATALSAFADTLIATSSTQAAQYAAARTGAEHFAYPEYKDLYHYAQLVKANTSRADVRAAADSLLAAIDSAVIAAYHGDAHPNAHGISIFIPTPTQYARDASLYVPLALAKQTHWDEWLAMQVQ